MVEQTEAPISRVDLDRLYVDNWAPESWLHLEVRTVELLEQRLLSTEQSRVLVHGLRELQERGEPVPRDGGDLYLKLRPVLQKIPAGYG